MVGIHIDFFQQNCCFNSQRWKVLGISKPNVNYLCSKYHIVLLHTFIDNHPNLSLHDMNHPNLRWCYNPYNTCDFDWTLFVSTIPNTYLGSCEACSEGISQTCPCYTAKYNSRISNPRCISMIILQFQTQFEVSSLTQCFTAPVVNPQAICPRTFRLVHRRPRRLGHTASLPRRMVGASFPRMLLECPSSSWFINRSKYIYIHRIALCNRDQLYRVQIAWQMYEPRLLTGDQIYQQTYVQSTNY